MWVKHHLLYTYIMLRMELTPLQGKKLILLTLHYFPEFKKITFSSYPKGSINLFKPENYERPSLRIHWFEWTMTHLSARYADTRDYKIAERFAENWNLGRWKAHPIDLLYKEYLNEIT